MFDIIFSFILSIIASFCYDAIKNVLIQRKSNKSNSYIKMYSKKYVDSVKKEFYICFPVGIAFLWFSNTSNITLKLFDLIMSGIMFFFALMAFVCAIDVINYFSQNNSNDDDD